MLYQCKHNYNTSDRDAENFSVIIYKLYKFIFLKFNGFDLKQIHRQLKLFLERIIAYKISARV